VARDESGGISVHPSPERVCLSGVPELVRVSSRVAVKGSGVRVVPGNVRVERGRGSFVSGGARVFALGCAGRGMGRVVALVGGKGG